MAIKNRDPEGALLFLRQRLADMRAGRLDIDNFIISKELHTYEPKTRSPHVTMCQRIKARSVADAPVLGTKVQYVLRRGAEDISDRAYPPDEVEPSEIDMDFYFERQILKPLTEILAPLCGGQAKLKRLLTNEHAGQHEITSLFEWSGTPRAEEEREAKKKRPAVKSKDIHSFFTSSDRQDNKRVKVEGAPTKKTGKTAKAKEADIKTYFAAGEK